MHGLIRSVVCVAAVAIAAGAARADLVGATYEVMDFAPPGATTYRIYLEFDDPADQLLEVTGMPGFLPFSFSTDTALLNDGGAFSGLKQEDFPAYPLSELWDSWLTIERDSFVTHETEYDNNFLGYGCTCAKLLGNFLDDGTRGWFDAVPESPANPGEDGRILIAQLTVADTSAGAPGSVLMTATGVWESSDGTTHQAGFGIEAATCPVAPDLDDSGVVDFGDVLALLVAWGECGRCREDLNDDGDVDGFDLFTILRFWGACG